MMALRIRELKYAMSAGRSTPSPHHIGVLMCPEGRFLECINCRLSFEFHNGAHYGTVAKQFESHSCGAPPRSKNDANVGKRLPTVNV